MARSSQAMHVSLSMSNMISFRAALSPRLELRTGTRPRSKAVPYVEDAESYYLKSIIPGRKAT
jgi:hypothetical protein